MITTKLRLARTNLIQPLSSLPSQTQLPKEGPHVVSEKLLSWAGIPKSTICLAITLILLCPMTFINMSYAAGRVFADGFEDGTTNAWSQDDFRNKCTASSTAADRRYGAHSGSYMAYCNWNGLVAWNDPAATTVLKLNSWSMNREFLIRTWVRYDADVDHKNGGKTFRLSTTTGGTNSYYYGVDMTYPDGGHFFTYWESSADRPCYCTFPLGNGQWHKVEIYVLRNTPGLTDGINRVWIDGQLQQEHVNVTTTATGVNWYPLYLMSNWSNNPGWEHDANNHVYWDDIEIFSDTGAGGFGLMSDATITQAGNDAPPQPPQNLRVQ